MLVAILVFVILQFMLLVSIYDVLKKIFVEISRESAFVVSVADDGSQIVREIKG